MQRFEGKVVVMVEGATGISAETSRTLFTSTAAPASH
jgi:hypothetical protein